MEEEGREGVGGGKKFVFLLFCTFYFSNQHDTKENLFKKKSTHILTLNRAAFKLLKALSRQLLELYTSKLDLSLTK